MILGDFHFNLKTMTPTSLTRTTEYNWASVDRVGGLSNLQNLGMSKDHVEIEGVFYPKFKLGYNIVNEIENRPISGILNFLNFMTDFGYNSVEAIRSSKLCRTANNLISDNGEILGKFVISSIRETQTIFGTNGNPQKIEFTLDLERSPSETDDVTWNGTTSSVVGAVTSLARSYLRW